MRGPARSLAGPRCLWRPICITAFALLWMSVFHYETLRLRYLSPLLPRLLASGFSPGDPERRRGIGRELPKLKLLYPPAGWIMFFNVDRRYGMAEVYGLRDGRPVLLDPHDIFRTRGVLYDNIRRNMLISVLSPARAHDVCRCLARQFPAYETFAVVYAQYPDVVDRPAEVQRQVAYRCPIHSP